LKSLALDRSGNVAIAGYIFGTTTDLGGGTLTGAGGGDILLAKYSGADGHYLWGKLIGSTGSDTAFGVAVDPVSGNVLVTGNYNGTVDFGGGGIPTSGGTAIYVACYNSSGGYVWVNTYGGQPSSSDVGTGVAIDGNGNIAITGNVQSAVDFGSGWLFGDGAQDYFLLKLSSSGQYQWGKRANGANGAGVSFDSSKNVLTGGSFGGTLDFGGDSVSTPYGSKSCFSAKYNP